MRRPSTPSSNGSQKPSMPAWRGRLTSSGETDMKITTLAALGGWRSSALRPAPGCGRPRPSTCWSGPSSAASSPAASIRVAGFGFQADGGEWRGLDIDLCRAIAAAIFDDPTKVRFVQTTAQTRLHRCADGRCRPARPQRHLYDSRDTGMGMAWPPSTTMTARASWSARLRASPRSRASTAPRSASRRARPPNSTSPTISAPTTFATRW